MKLYLDCKNLFNSIFILLLLVIPVVFSYAETASQIRDKIDEKSVAISKLEEQIKVFQNQLDLLGKQKDSLSVSLQQLDITRKKLNTDIAVTQNKIDKTNLTIADLSSDIGDKEESIKNSIDSIKIEIKNTNEFEQTSIVENVLSQNDFTVAWNDIDNMLTLREKLRENIIKLKETKGVLEDTRTVTINAKNELVALKSKLADQQKIVIQNANEKSKLLSETKNSEVNYQKLVAEQIAKKLAFEKELRDFESQLQFILDPSKLPSSGVLSWPLDKVFVTQEFGSKTGPHRTYTNGHGGTDFRARTPLPVYSMADGIVKGVGDTDTICPGVSFGKWVLVEYNNGLSSTFGHLSLIKVKEGQKVKRDQTVAYSGGTGRSTAPHLHVSLYASSGVKVSNVPSISCLGKVLRQPIAAINAYLDPMYYLPRYVPQP